MVVLAFEFEDMEGGVDELLYRLHFGKGVVPGIEYDLFARGEGDDVLLVAVPEVVDVGGEGVIVNRGPVLHCEGCVQHVSLLDDDPVIPARVLIRFDVRYGRPYTVEPAVRRLAFQMVHQVLVQTSVVG